MDPDFSEQVNGFPILESPIFIKVHTMFKDTIAVYKTVLLTV